MSRATEQAGRGHAIEARRFHTRLVLMRIAVVLALLGFVLGAMLAYLAADEYDRHRAIGYARTQAEQRLNPKALLGLNRPMETITVPVSFDDPVATRLLWRMGVAGSVLAILLGGGLTVLVRRHWIATARDAALDQVVRGNRIATAEQLTRLVLKTRPAKPFLTIGGVPVPPQAEPCHLLAVGKSGSGKTTFLQGHGGQIVERGEHALIFDPDGSYIEHFYRPERGDVILNVFDARTARWNPLADVAGLADAYRIAAILLPKPSNIGENGIWYDQAHGIVAQMIAHLAASGASLDDLATMLNTATPDSLRAIMAGTPAARVFEAGGERATASVLFMTGIAARTVDMLARVPKDAPAFSFDRFYQTLADHPGPKPLIFLAAPRRYRAAAAPVIAAWIDAAASAILQRDPGNAPNAWLILDELPSLPPVQSLLTLLPEGRKHRACCVLAFQSIAQMRERYGAEGAEIITGQTATQLLLSVGDHATAKWAVDLAGTIEVENQRASEQLGDKGGGSLALHRERKSLILDSEMTGLRVGEGFLRLSGFPVAKVRIAPGAAMPVLAPAFVSPPASPRELPDAAALPATRVEDREDWLSLGGL